MDEDCVRREIGHFFYRVCSKAHAPIYNFPIDKKIEGDLQGTFFLAGELLCPAE